MVFLGLVAQQTSQARLEPKKHYQFSPPLLKMHHKKLVKISNKKGVSLWHAIVTGDKSRLSKDQLQKYKHMGLMHVLTPSGLHLGSVIWLQKLLPQRLFIAALFFLSMGISLLPTYFPIKRILIFKWFKLSTNVNNELLFLLTFIMDLCLGFYSQSPMSSLLSFLFWGTIITHKKFQGPSLLKKMSLNLLLVNLIFLQSTSFLAFFINPLVSLFVGISFPLLILGYAISPFIPYLAKTIATSLSCIDSSLAYIDRKELWIPPSPLFLLIFLGFILKNKKLIFIILLIGSTKAGEGWKIKIPSGKWLKPPGQTRRL